MKLSIKTGNPLSFWEGLTMIRLDRWIETWNHYAQTHRKQ